MRANNPLETGASAGGELNCLVIQLSRSADVYHTLLSLRAVKKLYPQVKFSIIARETFLEPFKHVDWIEKVYPLDTSTLRIEASVSRVSALKSTASWLSEITEKKWDYIIDWTFSETSSWLSSVIPTNDRIGFVRGNDLSLSCADGWSQYVQAVIQGGIPQDIHLTDIFATQLLTLFQIRLGVPEKAGEEAVTGKDFFGPNSQLSGLDWMHSNKRWISIQLGASKNENAWSPKEWALLATEILDRHADVRILLLGTERDQERERAFFTHLSERASIGDRIQSFVGKTDFKDWSSIIAKSQWFFAAKTSAIHVASLLGTRVLHLHPGDKTWREAGPYGNGHWVILPPNAESNLNEIDAASVYSTWLRATGQVVSSSGKNFKVKIYKSKIRSTELGGGVQYVAQQSYPLEFSDWISLVHGYVARAWYCGWVPKVGFDLKPELLTATLIRELRKIKASLLELIEISKNGKRLSIELRDFGQGLKSDRLMSLEDRESIQKKGKELFSCGERIEKISEEMPEFIAFSRMIRVMMHNLDGTRLYELSEESAVSFKLLEQGFHIYLEWIETTLGLNKPRAVTIAKEEELKV